jgi:hypothetical protein
MKRIVRLTESDLTRIVRRVIMEQATATKPPFKGVNVGNFKLADNKIIKNFVGTGRSQNPSNKTFTLYTTDASGKYGVKINCQTKVVDFMQGNQVLTTPDKPVTSFNLEFFTPIDQLIKTYC